MSENTGEMPTPATSEMPEATAVTPEPKTTEAMQAEYTAMQAALKKANAEAAKYRKEADTAAAAQKAKEEAELSEMDKLKRQLAEIQQEAVTLKLAQLKAKVASEMGLPEGLAARLQGNDEDELKADAEQLLKAIPKPAKPQIQPTNPANAQPPGETDAMRRQRIFSGGSTGNVFDPASASTHGGGVVWQEKN